MRAELTVLLVVLLAPTAGAQDESPLDVLRVGHWLEVKGTLESDGRFHASDGELHPPAKYETLVGTVTTDARGGSPRLLGQPLEFDDETEWERVTRDTVSGARVKIEGRWKGPRRFSAREVSTRGPGRDAVEGRVDVLRAVEGGLEAELLRFTVFLPGELLLEHEVALDELELAPYRERADDVDAFLGRDEEDYIPGAVKLAEGIRFGAQLELESTFEEDLDLDRTAPRDRRDYELSFRGRVIFEGTERWSALATVRHGSRLRDDQDDGRSHDRNTRLAETWFALHDLAPGLDVYAGRMDFDDEREWVWDQNLDGVRLVWDGLGLRTEFAVTTTLGDGSPRDEESTNLMLYVSNGDDDRHLAAWVLDRRAELGGVDDYPFHAGVRALGEWWPDTESWVEIAAQRGYRGFTDLGGVAIDLGATFEPEWAEPFNFTLGWARASGDADRDDGDDGNFRQTGYQDNNGKFAGVTSFRYYGELVDPELSNLRVLTAGVGVQLARRTSLDLVWHAYSQDVATDFYAGDFDLRPRPNGRSRTLGSELDLVLGSRRWDHMDVELVGAWFQPGAAYDQQDDAWLAKVQLRFRL